LVGGGEEGKQERKDRRNGEGGGSYAHPHAVKKTEERNQAGREKGGGDRTHPRFDFVLLIRRTEGRKDGRKDGLKEGRNLRFDFIIDGLP
jgi:hypothetical protein